MEVYTRSTWLHLELSVSKFSSFFFLVKKSPYEKKKVRKICFNEQKKS